MKPNPDFHHRNLVLQAWLWPFLLFWTGGLDLYPHPAGTNTEEAEYFSADMGGSAGNIAVALAQQGAAVLLTVFSDDQVGRFVMLKCKRYGVDTDCRTPDRIAIPWQSLKQNRRMLQ